MVAEQIILRSAKVKGNVNINPALGMTMVVPYQSVKVRSPGHQHDIAYGLDAIRTTTRQMKLPGTFEYESGFPTLSGLVTRARAFEPVLAPAYMPVPIVL